MKKLKSIVIALFCFSLYGAEIPFTLPGASGVSRAVAQQAPSAAPPSSPQLDQSPADETDPPVKKKKYTPAPTLNQALFLASREDTDTSAYLNQAKSMIGQSGADLKASDAQGRTPLHWAVLGAIYADKKLASAYADITELLIAKEADINAEDVYGNTPLDYQDVSSAEEMLELLLENGARHANGKNDLAQMQSLLQRISTAANSGDISKVRSALSADLPLSTILPIKLTTIVSSHTSRAGDAIAAVVAAPIIIGDRIIIAPGTKIEGTVMYTSKSHNRFERSQLVLDFANLVGADGTKSRLSLQVAGVDNARETVESNRIIGVNYPNSALGQNKVSWGMRLIGIALPALGYAMEASTLVYAKKFNREIRYEAGTDMNLQVMIPANVKVPADLKGFAILTPSADLIKLVNAQPQRVDTAKGEPVDVTNVMLIGSQAQVEGAFRAASWEEAKSLGVKSGLETFGAILFEQGYEKAPFSDLYMKGQAPDLTYQKQLNTFAKRNHIRIWKVSAYDGRDVWVGAATHDIGMGIDRNGDKLHWYHTVDIRVDGERTKILNDLMFAGGTKAYSLVERPGMPKHNLAPGNDPRDTDGKMLVLKLN